MALNIANELNFYDEFKEWYLQIINDFKFDYEEDCKSRDYLSQILIKKSHKWKLENILESFKNIIKIKQSILIYGCGPSLEKTVDVIITQESKDFFENFINLAADGASVLLREKSIPIDAIFTDLDGITKDEFNYSRFNIIHAHGDNINKLKLFKDEILNFENVIGTTQVEPLGNIINPGGFTDGDRIIFFLRKLINPSQKLFLIGMDFKDIVGKYSKLEIKRNQEGSLIKKKKLQYAVKLIEWLKPKIINEIFFVNSEKISEKFKYLSLEKFMKNLNF